MDTITVNGIDIGARVAKVVPAGTEGTAKPAPTSPLTEVKMPQRKQRVWFAVLLVDSQFAQGAFRRSLKAHWSALDARQELNGWVNALKLGPVVVDELSDQIYVGRVPGYFAIIASLLMPKGLTPTDPSSFS